MRKILFFVYLISLPFMSWARCSIPVSSVTKQVDTLMYRQIAPGTMYTKMYFPEYPFNVYMLTIDLNNQYNAVETFQAEDQAGRTEAMTSAYKRLATENHVPIGSVNGNFWIVSGQGQPDALLGVPHSGSIRNGEMVTDPNDWNRGHGSIGFAVLDADKKMWINDMAFDGKVQVDGKEDYPIAEINRVRQTDELVFFNHYVGTKTRSDDDGTEVFIKLIDREFWGINEGVKCQVTRIVKDKGNNEILYGESVLSGNGKAKTYLGSLSVGQQITVNMGVYTLTDNMRPLIKQMITGNALVMKNGELTERNTNESYNSQTYPRTGIGMSKDGKTLFLIVIDKSAGSVGANTATMCDILKAAGAYNVTSMDGGGSAQMMLQGVIVNKPSDGRERAVANGLMLFSTAPLDEIIKRIDWADYNLLIPANASYKPEFLGYNKYDMLCTENMEGVTLTCDPALGSIKNGNLFVASSTPQTGYLVAHYQGKEYRKLIKIEDSEIAFRLETVILDGNVEYPIEVLATANKVVFNIEPSLLTWTVEDEHICKITNGVLKAVSKGTTYATGSYGDFSGNLKVMVEIPDNTSLDCGDFASSAWKVTTNIPNANQGLSSQGRGGVLDFIYNSVRAPYVTIANDIRFYSLPKAIKFVINPKGVSANRLFVTLKVNNEKSDRIIELEKLNNNIDNEFIIQLSSMLDNVNDLGCYPITFKSLKFMLDATLMSVGANYSLDVKEFSLLYETANYMEEVKNASKVLVYPNPICDGKLYVSYQGKGKDVSVFIYSITGRQVRSFNFKVFQSNIIPLDVTGLSTGEYLLHLSSEGNHCTSRFIIR